MAKQDYLTFTNRTHWRSWLKEHHSESAGAWLQIQKKNSPVEGIFLDEAVEEALCFGWIDSTLNPRDEHSYLLRFSPRKASSVWSISNIQRAATLIDEGRMREAGFAAIQAGKESGEWEQAIQREDPDYIPEDLRTALNQDPDAQLAYQALSESKRKRFVYWLQSAKQEQTRQKRVTEILKQLSPAGQSGE